MDDFLPIEKVHAEPQEAEKLIPAISTDHKSKDSYTLYKKRFNASLGCLVVKTQSELMIHLFFMQECW